MLLLPCRGLADTGVQVLCGKIPGLTQRARPRDNSTPTPEMRGRWGCRLSLIRISSFHEVKDPALLAGLRKGAALQGGAAWTGHGPHFLPDGLHQALGR